MSRFLQKEYFNIEIPYRKNKILSIKLLKVNITFNPKLYRIQVTLSVINAANREWIWWKHIILINKDKRWIIMLDKETEALVKIILLLESLTQEERDRILTYLDMKYIPIPEYNFEYDEDCFE